MAKDTSALGRLSGSIGQGATIAKIGYDAEKETPSHHDNDAALFSSIAQSFSKPGQRPRGFLRNLGAGLAEGAAHGARSKGIEEKKDKSQKFQEVIGYLQNANNAAAEQNKWYAEREMKMETIKPFAMGGLEVSYSGMDYATGNDRMRNIMEQAKIADPSIKGDYVGYIPNTPIVNMRDADGKITALSLSSIVGEDAVKRVQGNYIDQQKIVNGDRDFDQKERKLKAQYPNYGKQEGEAREPEPFEYNGNSYDVVPLTGLEKTEKSDYGKMVNKSVSQIVTNENAITSINNMKEVFERNPHIGESWVNMLSSGDDEDTWGRWIAKKFTSRQERADMEILKKASNDLNLSVVLSIPGKSGTDIMKRAVQAASPTGTLTKLGFDKIADEWETRAISNIDMAKAQAHARAQGKMIVQRNKSASDVSGENNSGDLSDLGKRIR